MIQKTFGIYPESEVAQQLFIELGPTHVVCWTVDNEKKLSSFEFFQSDDHTRTHLNEVFAETKLHSKLLSGSYENVGVILDNECCLILPATTLGFEEKSALVKLAFGENAQTISRNSKDDHTFLFTVNKKVAELLSTQYSNATVRHKYEWLNEINLDELEYQLLLTCYLGHCIILLKQKGKLLLLQRYGYHTPEDVVYYVLNVCKQMNISLEELSVQVQGLVAEESELYAELHKYIPNISLYGAEDIEFTSDAFSEYPAHYFSSFVNAVV